MIERFDKLDNSLRSKDEDAMKTESVKFSVNELNVALATANQLKSAIMTDLTKVTEGEKYTDKEKAAVMTLPEGKE